MKQNNNTSSAILIERKQPNGNIRIVVQLYAGGTKVQESTGIIIKPGDSRKDKIEKRNLAELYRKKREEELKFVVLGVKNPECHLDDSFMDYYDKITLSRTKNTMSSWTSARLYIVDYAGEDFTFRQVTKEWIRGFKEFLSSAKSHHKKNGKTYSISQNTQSSMFSKIIATLNSAVSEEIIPYSPALGIKGIPITESVRTYLSENELKLLMDTPCVNEETKRAFFFSCFTGFRFSDISNMTWENVKPTELGYSVSLKMKKTSTPIYQTISRRAESFLDIRSEGKVFPALQGNPSVNKHLDEWAKAAGISKKVTFHTARHTFATLLIKRKADIYTVSKLLGHSKVTTTQIYAKIVDETKRSAVNSLNDIL